MKKMGIIQEHEIIKTKLEIQEQALKNIIQAIHDNIGQILSLAKLHLGTLDFSRPEEVAQKTFTSNELIGRAIKDLRHLARHLDAEYVNRIGLTKALLHELGYLPSDRIEKHGLTVNGTIGTFNEEEELILFRLIQEALQGLLKSSTTSRLQIEVNSLAASLHIHLIAEEIEPDQHFDTIAGLVPELHEKATPIRATTTLQKPSDTKTIITITFPYSGR